MCSFAGGTAAAGRVKYPIIFAIPRPQTQQKDLRIMKMPPVQPPARSDRLRKLLAFTCRMG